MTDIQKMIEEASIKYSSQFAEENREESKDDFLHGANFALSQLQNANRWRRVEVIDEKNIPHRELRLLHNLLTELLDDCLVSFGGGEFERFSSDENIDLLINEIAKHFNVRLR